MPFPSSLDTYTAVAGTTLLSSADHANQHNVAGSAVVALETKLGLSAGSPIANAILQGSGNGTSIWSASLNNATFGTPRITGGTISGAVIGTNTVQGGTINNAVIGTPTLQSPTITLSSDATGDLFTRSSGGSITRIASGSVGQVLKGNGAGTAPTWGNAGILGNTVTPTGTQTTTATSATPMANGTLSIPLTASANIQLFANAQMGNNAAGGYSYLSLTLGGTQVGPEVAAFQGEDHGVAVNGFMGSVAVGTYSAIVKFRGNTGTVTSYNANLWYTSYPV